jgi:TRAP-type C4-dicarboxylate transport system permease small subunit
MHAANRLILSAVSAVTAVLAGLLVTLVLANVAGRYLFGTGFTWAEELSRLLFVWTVFLGAYIALCRKGHMAIVMVVERFPDNARRVIAVLGWILVLIFVSIIAFSGFRLALATWGFGRTTPILRISAAWGYLAVPVSAVLMILPTLIEVVDAWRRPPARSVPGQSELGAAL